MPRSPARITAALSIVAVLAGCASDHKTVTSGPANHVRLSGDREPFVFSSYDVGRVEWSCPDKDANAVPPDVSAVLADGTVLPLRGLTLATAKATRGLSVGPATKVDDGQGDVWPAATPATGSGWRFDFVGDKLVHAVAAPVANPDGSTTQPALENHAVQDADVNGDVRVYTLPLDHDACVHLFGGANGLETDLQFQKLLPG